MRLIPQPICLHDFTNVSIPLDLLTQAEQYLCAASSYSITLFVHNGSHKSHARDTKCQLPNIGSHGERAR